MSGCLRFGGEAGALLGGLLEEPVVGATSDRWPAGLGVGSEVAAHDVGPVPDADWAAAFAVAGAAVVGLGHDASRSASAALESNVHSLVSWPIGPPRVSPQLEHHGLRRAPVPGQFLGWSGPCSTTCGAWFDCWPQRATRYAGLKVG